MAEKDKRIPTALDVYIDCLCMIQELPPGERKRVVDALGQFRDWSETVLTCAPREGGR